MNKNIMLFSFLVIAQNMSACSHGINDCSFDFLGDKESEIELTYVISLQGSPLIYSGLVKDGISPLELPISEFDLAKQKQGDLVRK